MTVKKYRVQVVLPSLSGLARDAVINDIVLSYDDGSAVDVPTAITNFFNVAAPGSAHPAAYYMNDSIDRSANACTLKFYDITTHLDGSDTGPPAIETSFTLAASSGASALPDEVAMAVSYHADLTGVPEFSGGIRPRSRRRGRLFLGPLNITPIAVDSTTHNVFISAPTITNLNAQASEMQFQLRSDPNGYWGVWSKKDAAVRPVVGGWMDNRFDSQRRRMPRATSRTTWDEVLP